MKFLITSTTLVRLVLSLRTGILDGKSFSGRHEKHPHKLRKVTDLALELCKTLIPLRSPLYIMQSFDVGDRILICLAYFLISAVVSYLKMVQQGSMAVPSLEDARLLVKSNPERVSSRSIVYATDAAMNLAIIGHEFVQ